MVLSFGLHGAMLCHRASTVSAASERCSHEHNGCPHRSTPTSPVQRCCANFACLSDAQCSGVEEAAVIQANVAQFQPVSASVSIFPSAAALNSPRVPLIFHS